jgi:hypothetical protein
LAKLREYEIRKTIKHVIILRRSTGEILDGYVGIVLGSYALSRSTRLYDFSHL